ncbi:Schizosaccharomyces specific protein [Schizosaccharomyces osmophilus]|uniref:Schizosaccharomyces specific protein n=1 Tax=Schizosaccharomyces osmophilus TaxID=2545709 RepID=A0AAF0AWM2_9SCHI|nr:Schizosaccharomyces specific protein [Schizosaccharomyces osmophilus]WBW74881.1 Schizosaccharomyces specific protein [Schizosaccharomyces osmophilus]
MTSFSLINPLSAIFLALVLFQACTASEISNDGLKKRSALYPDMNSKIANTPYYNISEGTYCHVSGSNLCVSPQVIAICANHSTVLLNCPTVLGYPSDQGASCIATEPYYGLTRGLCQIGASNSSGTSNSSNFDTKSSSPSKSSKKSALPKLSLSYSNVVEKPLLFARDSLDQWACNKTYCNEEYPHLVNTCFNGTQYPVNCNNALRTAYGGATCQNIGYENQGICVYTNNSRALPKLNASNSSSSFINLNKTSLYRYRNDAFIW